MDVDLSRQSGSTSGEMKRKLRKSLPFYLWILPGFVLLIVFNYWPPISALYHSFTAWNGVTSRFNGMQNFVQMIHDSVFWLSMIHVAVVAAAGMVKDLVPSLVLAEALFLLRSSRLRQFFQTIQLVPVVVPGTVVILLWQYIFDPMNGAVNKILTLIGFAHPPLWFGDQSTALLTIILAGFPWINPVNTLILLAGLFGISESVVESAKLDGCTGLKRVVKIDFPSILSQVRLVLILSVIANIQHLGFQLLVTTGGPGNSTIVPAYYLYENAFEYSQMGYASAIGVTLFVLILALTLLNMKFIKPSDEFKA